MRSNRIKCLKIEVEGIVQGVGFRPFVYRLAHSLNLNGWVANTVHGVRIEAEGDREALEHFIGRLKKDAPPMAEVKSLRRKSSDVKGYKTFDIRTSVSHTGRSTLICPDAAVCEDCLAEMRDRRDRRYRYPFINCTNCGPRYTIILDLPYDRARTTMSSFTMCPECREEFEDPLNRRFHAQPNACPVCGPQVVLVDRQGCRVGNADWESIEQAAGILLDGKVLAVKGLGGFHLAVDATSEAAARRLRERKRRQDKPFAVMFPSLESVRGHCRLSAVAVARLTSPARPIVLLPVRAGSDRLAPSVAAFQNDCGAMLPYTPLHHLLLDAAAGVPLVMTSGNHSDEPIEIENESALCSLGHIADYFLLHDRPIHMRCDDSVFMPAARKTVPIRRSRGYVPRPVSLRFESPPVLAVGGHLKNTICLTRGREAFLSQHVGDLDSPEVMKFFRLTVEQIKRLLEVEPVLVAHDLHPDYLSTRWALERSGLPAVAVQHHHAHVAACMAEHSLTGKVLGISMDGTGYGGDGTVWGGEFLVADEVGFERVGHLPYQPMPGGEAAVREPWRMARSVFGAVLGAERLNSFGHELWEHIGGRKVELIDRMLERKLNCPLSSGCGRLFDAVAALIGLRRFTLYEGQPAMELESLAMQADGRNMPVYPFEPPVKILSGEPLIPDLGPMIEAIARDVSSDVEASHIALGFHHCLARVINELGGRLARHYGLNRVILTGGVFNNRYLLETVGKSLRCQDLKVFSHSLVPAGDGGISL
ncbi:carbamoyltransferase HypF, partial [Gemmatimonadota bacterium]